MPGIRITTVSNSNRRLFSDIDNHWAKGCIEELASQDLVTGDPDGHFRPNDPITRAEFAVLMYWVFPKALPVREMASFSDVPSSHWANKVVKWVYERGLFSGYPDRSFRPDASIFRADAIAVLVKGLNYVVPLQFQPILEQYFDDAAEVPVYAKGAIATAALSRLVVNYPDVRKLRPHQPITRGEVAALLCQTLGRSQAVPPWYVTWYAQLQDIQGETVIPLEQMRGNPTLVKEIQTRLYALRLHPGDAALNGIYSAQTEAALIEFCRILELPNRSTYALDKPLAQTLLSINPIRFILTQASDRQRIFQEYLQQEVGYNAAKLAFLDKGIQTSPYQSEIKNYPTYLTQKLTEQAIAISTRSLVQDGLNAAVSFKPFPKRGDLPQIDTDGLAFLHSDIQQACICLCSLIEGQLKARWLGRDGLANVELWSATKFIPLLNIVSKVNSNFLEADIDNELIRPGRGSKGFSFYDLAVDMINYKSSIGSSNSLAAMFKQFETPQNLENWVKSITGNTRLQFRGRYGEGAFIQVPQLWDHRLKKVVLNATSGGSGGSNTISTYDLTRLITMLGLHPHLPTEARLPGAQWNSLESVVRAMGTDSARYVDVALERLGLNEVIATPVIISKLGFGRSSIRNRTELVYSAFVRFIDRHLATESGDSQAGEIRMIGMTLLGAKNLGNGDREATELDARMAAEVTEILRRLVTQAL
jgi:hypothetical protein